MKTKNLITAIALLSICTKSFAQMGTPLTIDFSGQKNLYETTRKYNESFNITVTNINRNLFKIDGIKTETDFNIVVPSILSTVKLPSFLTVNAPKIEKGSAPSVGTKSSAEILESIKYYQDNLPLNKMIAFNNELLRLAKDCGSETEIRGKLLKLGDYFSGNTPGSQNAEPTAVTQAISAKFETLISDTEVSLKELNALVNKYANQANKELKDADQAAKISVKDIEKELKKTNLSSTDRAESEEALKSSQKIINEYPDRVLQVKTTDQTLKDNLKKANDTVEELNKAIKEDKPYAIIKLFKQLIHPNTYTFVSEDITPKTDELKYTITIEPTELNTCKTGGKRVIVIVVKVRGGLKLDFSTGAFMSGGSNKFLGNSYYYHNIDANTREIIAADRGSRYMLSIGALMHIYRRSEKTVKLAGSVGVSSTVSLTDLNFHAGPSLLIGNKNRLVISTGLTLKSALILDQKLSTNKTYTKLESPDAIPTVSVFPLAGYYFGISYNISKFTSSK